MTPILLIKADKRKKTKSNAMQTPGERHDRREACMPVASVSVRLHACCAAS